MQKLIEIKPQPVQKGFAEFKNNLSNKNNDENYKRILNVYNNIKFSLFCMLEFFNKKNLCNFRIIFHCIFLFFLIISTILIFKHHTNIKRLLNNSESKIKF